VNWCKWRRVQPPAEIYPPYDRNFPAAPFVNLMKNLVQRAGRVIVRVGGNSQEDAQLVDDLGTAIVRASSDDDDVRRLPSCDTSTLTDRDLWHAGRENAHGLVHPSHHRAHGRVLQLRSLGDA
jgi:hypothetical protein